MTVKCSIHEVTFEDTASVCWQCYNIERVKEILIFLKGLPNDERRLNFILLILNNFCGNCGEPLGDRDTFCQCENDD